MNKGDFLSYIVLHCCTSVFKPRDCIKIFSDVITTSRVCRSIFTWKTQHLSGLCCNAFERIVAQGDVYLLHLYKKYPFVIAPLIWRQSADAYYAMFNGVHIGIAPNGSVSFRDESNLTLIIPEKIKESIRIIPGIMVKEKEIK